MIPEDNKNIRLLRMVAIITAMVGAAISLTLLLRAATHTPLFLLILYIGWVLLPFAALLLADFVPWRWTPSVQIARYSLMLVITIGSLLIYNGVFIPEGTRPAAIFLMVPLASWVLIALVVPIVGKQSKGNSQGER